MQVQVSFKNMAALPHLKTVAARKIGEKVRKFADDAIRAHVTFAAEGQGCVVRCFIVDDRGSFFQADHHGSDFVTVMDRILDKLDAQLRRRKGKEEARKLRRLGWPADVLEKEVSEHAS